MSSSIWIAIGFACQLTVQIPARVELERSNWLTNFGEITLFQTTE